MRYGAKGPNILTSTACAASSHAIGEAMHAIRSGTCDVVIAGGAESTVTPLGVGGFCSMKALSTRNDDPTAASRPFDKDRDGFVIGEGAAILILEELEFARNRGAKIYAEICGYGASADAYHVTAPAPGGEGAARAMAAAMADGGVAAEQHRLHQRARDLHPVQRPVRDDGHQDRLRGAREKHSRQLDQVDDGPPARGVRRHRGDVLLPDDPRRRPSPDDQLHDPGPGMRPRLRSQREAGACRSGTPFPTPSASAARTPSSCSAGTRE